MAPEDNVKTPLPPMYCSCLEVSADLFILVLVLPTVDCNIFPKHDTVGSRDESCPWSVLRSVALLSEQFNTAYFSQRHLYPM